MIVPVVVILDTNAGVWIATCWTVGVVTHAETYEALLRKLAVMVPEGAAHNAVTLDGWQVVMGEAPV